jgi:hypothetical protein
MEKSWFAENKGWILTGILLITIVVVVFLMVYFFVKRAGDLAPYSFTKNITMTNSTTPGTMIYDVKCDNGSFITGFSSNTNTTGINQLAATCSNDQILGPFGDSRAGVPGNDVISETGFTQANVWYDNRVNGINIFNGNEFHTIGSLNGNESVQDCGADGRIVGFNGNGDGLVSNLGMICGYKKAQ